MPARSSTKTHDDQSKDAKIFYFKLPALNISIAFPQATPASIFPPSVSDYYHFDDLLTPEEQALRRKVRTFIEKEVAPIMTKGYGCPGLSVTGSAIACAEVARVDASCSTFITVHSCLAMLTIEAQKEKYLPSLARLDTIGCWALTEPDYGSDASSLKTTATKVAGGWILEGQKRWIGNSTFADVLVIFARNTSTNQLNTQVSSLTNVLVTTQIDAPLIKFLVMKDAPGLQATKMENKIGLRIVQNGDILLKKVCVPDADRLTGVNSFQDTNKV
ncbi:hypothetical protein AgCh_004342 [Apium graveolens]